ncbi:MAG: manganese-dependent inorganic pyrophosphatase [Rickettsiales bacterium]|jgi:manganese-dependent inorganic pyrophosphatase|nr:manganese-dependent inorganic pyrophosphatase [Rickettsiales bacterium]
MAMITVLGHKSPDTDSVVSAIAYAYLLNARRIEARPAVQGTINGETRFVLEKFGLNVPETVDRIAELEVALVDSTEPGQLPPDIAGADIRYIVDHHNLGGLKTPAPIEVWTRPVGCTCTILKLMFDFYRVEIPSDIAGAMMCAILSDTVMFKSPTTTAEDKKAVDDLEKKSAMSAVDVGMEMMRVKSSVENDSPEDLIGRDFKDFDIRGRKIGIGQIELVDLSLAAGKLPGIKAALQKLKKENGYFGILFMMTDIMKEGTELIAYTDDDAKVEGIFGIRLKDNRAWCQGMMSRKKQVVPPLEENL